MTSRTETFDLIEKLLLERLGAKMVRPGNALLPERALLPDALPKGEANDPQAFDFGPLLRASRRE